jgi:hypothetical protein
MNGDDILLTRSGVVFLGQPVGFEPKADDFERPLEGQHVRHMASVNGRQQRVCDSKGLSWLVDLDLRSVLSFEIHLAPFSYRPRNDHDPLTYFSGRVCVDQHTIRGAFSCQTAELVRKVAIPGVNILLVPDGNTVRSVAVEFVINARKSDAAKGFYMKPADPGFPSPN